MLNLPDVTLVVVETRAHELAQIALNDCLGKAAFGEVVIFTDKPDLLHTLGARIVLADDWSSKLGCVEFCQVGIADHVKTSHILFMEWDAGICDPTQWDNAFLEYDYIGAPWWYNDGMNVGNGGFSIRSTKLMKHLSKINIYPVINNRGDELICRDYRKRLEAHGFKWAPEDVAHRFAFERIRNAPASFGYHGTFNWPVVLERRDIVRRARLMTKHAYHGTTIMLSELLTLAPWLLIEEQAA